jgi:hypothetical protein
MSGNHRAACDQDVRLENFAAEITRTVYPLVLRCGLTGSWLKVELGLWRALTETINKWTRQLPYPASADELDDWQEGLVADLAESAFDVALKNGIKGSLLDLVCGIYAAVRPVIQKSSQVS